MSPAALHKQSRQGERIPKLVLLAFTAEEALASCIGGQDNRRLDVVDGQVFAFNPVNIAFVDTS